jgi:hypothetical protein
VEAVILADAYGTRPSEEWRVKPAPVPSIGENRSFRLNGYSKRSLPGATHMSIDQTQQQGPVRDL